MPPFFKSMNMLEDPQLTNFALNLAKVPLGYPLSLCLIIWLSKNLPLASNSQSQLLSYSTFSASEFQSNPPSFWNNVFSATNLNIQLYKRISLTQLILSLLAIFLSLFLQPLPQYFSFALTKWFITHLAYWGGYTYFITNFSCSRVFTQEFLLFNLFSWSITPVTYIIGLLLVDSIQVSNMKLMFFLMMSLQVLATSMLGLCDMVHMFLSLVYDRWSLSF